MPKNTIAPTPIPARYVPSGPPAPYQCPYRDEVHTVRRWNKWLWMLGTILIAGSVGAATYSLNVARQVGAFEATAKNLMSKQVEDHREIVELRTTTANLKTTTNELKTRLSAIDGRLERIEQTLSRQGRRKAMPFHYD